MSHKTPDNDYKPVPVLKEYLQRKEQEYDALLDCPIHRASKEITSLLAVYDYLTPEEISTRLSQLKHQGSPENLQKNSSWKKLLNKCKFWKISKPVGK
ncbi:hypothetical protein CRE_13615 [Caenorhabditis remanei]|uniref:Uncharacterized protein n=1 Tax=Caenorhabditis remanei TaxID=31234 RepID=E3N1A5_CAERE|nr:hypothetical protein CRE_13615 [Caenorhabditis remanei]